MYLYMPAVMDLMKWLNDGGQAGAGQMLSVISTQLLDFRGFNLMFVCTMYNGGHG